MFHILFNQIFVKALHSYVYCVLGLDDVYMCYVGFCPNEVWYMIAGHQILDSYNDVLRMGVLFYSLS